jgi:predicted metal-dependent hydrolase
MWDDEEKWTWWERIEWLTYELDFDRPVHVHRVKMSRNHGEVDDRSRPDRYIIRIDNTLDYQLAVWVLIHELAHCMEPYEDHGPAFWMAKCEVWAENLIFEQDYR